MSAEWHECDACGAAYRNGKAAVQCCADRLSEDGEEVRADGGPHLVVRMVAGGGIKPRDEVSFQPADGYSDDDWKAVKRDAGYDAWDIHEDYPADSYPPIHYPEGTVLGTVTFAASDDDSPEWDFEVEEQEVMADGSGAMGPGFHAAACHIERGGKRVAAGALLPSGAVAIEWNREAFPEGERTDHPTTSLYRSIDDAEEASGGSLVVDHAGGPSA